MHVDTEKKFPEMYAFRDRYAKEWNLNFIRELCPPVEATDPTLPPAARSASRKTLGLKAAVEKHGFKGLIPASAATRRRSAPRSAILAARPGHRAGTSRTSRPSSGTST